MQSLQKVIFPLTGLQKSLYYVVVDGYVAQHQNSLILDEKSRVSFNSYFNSFYENYWRTYTKLSDLVIKFTLQGKGLVVIYRDSQNNGCYEVTNHHFDNPEFQDVIVSVAEDVFESSGRIFVDIISDNESKVVLSSIEYLAENLQEEQKRLTVGICTFNRESFVHKNLSNLVELSKSFANLSKIFVVNQGDEFTNEKLLALLEQNSSLIQVVKQDNLGGTGGFTRTLFEAANSDVSDYHLLMDDDVIIDSKVIQTAFNFASNAKKPTAVGGQMLDLLRPNILHEYGGNVSDLGYITGLFHNLDVANMASLWHFNQVTKIDFNAWWFCMIPTQKIKEIDLPAPIFIRGDDQEYGLRLQKNGVETVGLPGVALWHEPFYVKVAGWQTYYDFRNRMILATTYDNMKNEPVSQLFLKIYRLLLIHDYQSVKLILQAIKDFSKGTALFNDSSDVIHARVAQLAKEYAPKAVKVNFKPMNDDKAQKRWDTKNRRINFAKQTALLSSLDFANKSPKHLWDRHVSPENVQCYPYVKSNGMQTYYYLYEPNKQIFRALLKEIVEAQQAYTKALKNNDWYQIRELKQEGYWHQIFHKSF